MVQDASAVDWDLRPEHFRESNRQQLSWTLSNLEMTAGEVKLKTIFVQRGLRCLTCPARL